MHLPPHHMLTSRPGDRRRAPPPSRRPHASRGWWPGHRGATATGAASGRAKGTDVKVAVMRVPPNTRLAQGSGQETAERSMPEAERSIHSPIARRSRAPHHLCLRRRPGAGRMRRSAPGPSYRRSRVNRLPSGRSRRSLPYANVIAAVPATPARILRTGHGTCSSLTCRSSSRRSRFGAGGNGRRSRRRFGHLIRFDPLRRDVGHHDGDDHQRRQRETVRLQEHHRQ